jgi:ABC-type glycerol-3-phosphate transport system permease component
MVPRLWTFAGPCTLLAQRSWQAVGIVISDAFVLTTFEETPSLLSRFAVWVALFVALLGVLFTLLFSSLSAYAFEFALTRLFFYKIVSLRTVCEIEPKCLLNERVET